MYFRMYVRTLIGWHEHCKAECFSLRPSYFHLKYMYRYNNVGAVRCIVVFRHIYRKKKEVNFCLKMCTLYTHCLLLLAKAL
jgi:hypothetical protein